MRVLITGMDGYLGWPLAVHLTQQGHEVGGIDNGLRRRAVYEVGCDSAVPISSMLIRLRTLGIPETRYWQTNLTDFHTVRTIYDTFRPDAIVYLGEMPSAPYSMIDARHAMFTHTNNVGGTLATLFAMREVCPDAHLVKLGTMGEYGTPPSDIPEGVFPPGSQWTMEGAFCGDLSGLMFPRAAGSWYHQTKVHDSHNVAFACRIWKLRATDIMQGVVYGTRIAAMGDIPELATRFDFDECFGTVLHRYCAQAVIGAPLSPYGGGGQTRGFLPLKDSMQCLTLALENPPSKAGEYRTFNQFAETYSVYGLAETVRLAGRAHGLDIEIEPVENPRIEAEQHRYTPSHEGLFRLGYRPTLNLREEVVGMLADLLPHQDRIRQRQERLSPTIRWNR